MKMSVCYGWLAGFYLLASISTLNAQIVQLTRLADNSEAQSQNKEDHHPWWVNLGGGPAYVSTDFAMSAGMVYCYQFDRSLISARILGITNDNPTVHSVAQSYVIYKMADYGVLYGPMWQSGCSYVSIGAGIGLVRAAYENLDETITNTSISIPIELQWFWRPAHFAGIGLYAYASINFEKTMYGVMLCAQLGIWQ